MSETKWTPGEWRIVKTERFGLDRMVPTWYVKSDNDVGIAVQPSFSDEDSADANARLIAAAPCLFEALDKMVFWHGARRPGDELLPPAEQPNEIAQAMAAIAKAKGE